MVSSYIFQTILWTQKYSLLLIINASIIFLIVMMTHQKCVNSFPQTLLATLLRSKLQLLDSGTKVVFDPRALTFCVYIFRSLLPPHTHLLAYRCVLDYSRVCFLIIFQIFCQCQFGLEGSIYGLTSFTSLSGEAHFLRGRAFCPHWLSCPNVILVLWYRDIQCWGKRKEKRISP